MLLPACRYWDFTMSHRWDSHWKKHGRAGPSPFAATPSHREQWQAQLTKLKQRAQQRRATQQDDHHTEQAEHQHAQPHAHGQQQQQQQSEPCTQTGQQDLRHQQQPIPGTGLEGHQQVVAEEDLDSLGWPEQHRASAQVMESAVSGHAPLHQSTCTTSVQQHASLSSMHAYDFREDSTDNSCSFSQAAQLESHGSTDRSSSMLLAMLTHQLLQHWQEQSLNWGVQLHSMMGAALLHVQGIDMRHHDGSHPVGSTWLAEDAAPPATADVTPHGLHLELMSNDGVMPTAQAQANAHQHEQLFACPQEEEISASGKIHANEYQSDTQRQSSDSAPFQTRHSQVQSQLAGLKRRAARKHGL